MSPRIRAIFLAVFASGLTTSQEGRAAEEVDASTLAQAHTSDTASDKRPDGLPVKHTKPIAFAESPGSGWGLRFVLSMLVVGGAALLGLRRWSRRHVAPANQGLRVVSRTVLGQRAELVRVEVDGQSLLLGVTPHTVQLVTILAEAAPDVAAESSQEELPRERASFETRLAELMGKGSSEEPLPPPRPVRTLRRIEGQAAGLLKARGRA